MSAGSGHWNPSLRPARPGVLESAPLDLDDRVATDSENEPHDTFVSSDGYKQLHLQESLSSGVDQHATEAASDVLSAIPHESKESDVVSPVNTQDTPAPTDVSAPQVKSAYVNLTNEPSKVEEFADHVRIEEHVPVKAKESETAEIEDFANPATLQVPAPAVEESDQIEEFADQVNGKEPATLKEGTTSVTTEDSVKLEESADRIATGELSVVEEIAGVGTTVQPAEKLASPPVLSSGSIHTAPSQSDPAPYTPLVAADTDGAAAHQNQKPTTTMENRVDGSNLLVESQDNVQESAPTQLAEKSSAESPAQAVKATLESSAPTGSKDDIFGEYDAGEDDFFDGSINTSAPGNHGESQVMNTDSAELQSKTEPSAEMSSADIFGDDKNSFFDQKQESNNHVESKVMENHPASLQSKIEPSTTLQPSAEINSADIFGDDESSFFDQKQESSQSNNLKFDNVQEDSFFNEPDSKKPNRLSQLWGDTQEGDEDDIFGAASNVTDSKPAAELMNEPAGDSNPAELSQKNSEPKPAALNSFAFLEDDDELLPDDDELPLSSVTPLPALSINTTAQPQQQYSPNVAPSSQAQPSQTHFKPALTSRQSGMFDLPTNIIPKHHPPRVPSAGMTTANYQPNPYLAQAIVPPSQNSAPPGPPPSTHAPRRGSSATTTPTIAKKKAFFEDLPTLPKKIQPITPVQPAIGLVGSVYRPSQLEVSRKSSTEQPKPSPPPVNPYAPVAPPTRSVSAQQGSLPYASPSNPSVPAPPPNPYAPVTVPTKQSFSPPLQRNSSPYLPTANNYAPAQVPTNNGYVVPENQSLVHNHLNAQPSAPPAEQTHAYAPSIPNAYTPPQPSTYTPQQGLAHVASPSSHYAPHLPQQLQSPNNAYAPPPSQHGPPANVYSPVSQQATLASSPSGYAPPPPRQTNNGPPPASRGPYSPQLGNGYSPNVSPAMSSQPFHGPKRTSGTLGDLPTDIQHVSQNIEATIPRQVVGKHPAGAVPVGGPTSLNLQAAHEPVDNEALLQRQFPVFHWSGSGMRAVLVKPVQMAFASNAGGGADVIVLPGKSIVKDSELLGKFPVPLTTNKGSIKSKKKEIEKFIDEKVAQLEGDFSSRSAVDYFRIEHRVILWKILGLFVKAGSPIANSSPELLKSVRVLLNPLGASVPGAGDNGRLTTSASDMHRTHMARRSSSATQALVQSIFGTDDVKALLSAIECGDRDLALRIALDKRLWAHALVIASSLGPAQWNDTVSEFVREEIRPFRNSSAQSLAMMYRVLAGAGESAMSEMMSNGLATIGSSANISNDTNLDPKMLAEWRHHVANILGNPSPNDKDALKGLGKALLKGGYIEAAHICFLLSGIVVLGADRAIPSYVLLGSDSDGTDLGLGRDVDSIQLSLVFEYLSGCIEGPMMPHLLLYKLQYCLVLEENGLISDAQKLMETVVATVKASPKGVSFSPGFLATLDKTETRLRVDSEGGGSWLKMGMSNKLWLNSFNKFVAGDDEPTSPTSVQREGEIFRKLAATPTQSRVVSVNNSPDAKFDGYEAATAGLPYNRIAPAANASQRALNMERSASFADIRGPPIAVPAVARHQSYVGLPAVQRPNTSSPVLSAPFLERAPDTRAASTDASRQTLHLSPKRQAPPSNPYAPPRNSNSKANLQNSSPSSSAAERYDPYAPRKSSYTPKSNYYSPTSRDSISEEKEEVESTSKTSEVPADSYGMYGAIYGGYSVSDSQKEPNKPANETEPESVENEPEMKYEEPVYGYRADDSAYNSISNYDPGSTDSGMFTPFNNAPSFGQSSENLTSQNDEIGYSGAENKNQNYAYDHGEDEMEDFGLGNKKKSNADVNADDVSNGGDSPPHVVELKQDKKAPAQKVVEEVPEKKSGWFGGGWFKRGGGSDESKPQKAVKMHLGDSKPTIVWDEKLKKWVNPNAPAEEKKGPPPPPMVKKSSTPASPAPMSRASTPGTTAPGTSSAPPGPAQTPPVSAPAATGPPGRVLSPGMPSSNPGMPPMSRTTTATKPISTGGGLDDLLAASAGAPRTKKRNMKNRYVDIMK